MVSTIRDSGFSNGTPWNPSITCGPEAPSPRMARPPDIWSRLAAVTASVVADRENTLTMLVASWTRSVRAATYASLVKASKPQASPELTMSSPAFSMSATWRTDVSKSAALRSPVPSFTVQSPLRCPVAVRLASCRRPGTITFSPARHFLRRQARPHPQRPRGGCGALGFSVRPVREHAAAVGGQGRLENPEHLGADDEAVSVAGWLIGWPTPGLQDVDVVLAPTPVPHTKQWRAGERRVSGRPRQRDDRAPSPRPQTPDQSS